MLDEWVFVNCVCYIIFDFGEVNWRLLIEYYFVVECIELIDEMFWEVMKFFYGYIEGVFVWDSLWVFILLKEECGIIWVCYDFIVVVKVDYFFECRLCVVDYEFILGDLEFF